MRYRTKREWALAKAREAREAAHRLGTERIPANDWRRVRGKMRAIESLRREADKFERIAKANRISPARTAA